MKISRLVSQLRSMLQTGTPRFTRDKAPAFWGRYTINDQLITGSVRRHKYQVARPPVSVLVIYRGELIGTITEFVGGATEWEWRFAYTTGFTITAADVMKEYFTLFAVGSSGARFGLQPDGAAQVRYIRSTRQPESEVELLVTFTKSGNAGTYLRDGWHNCEEQRTWTKGFVSSMEIPVSQPGARYRLEFSLRPFTAPDRLPVQRLDVYVNSYLISRSSLRLGDGEVTCDLPEDLTEMGVLSVRFEHPDAVSPRDLSPSSRDSRVVAISFQSLVLRRFL